MNALINLDLMKNIWLTIVIVMDDIIINCESLNDIIEIIQIIKINIELIWNKNHQNLNQDLKDFIV